MVEQGYQPQLLRKLSGFASFAITFSWMSVLMGVFSNYAFALNTAGAFSIWTWPIVAAGQMLVALVFAEIAGRIPLTGSLYNWNTKLGNPTIGWQAGWLTLFAYAVAGAAILVAIMTPLQSFLGISLSLGQIQIIGLGMVLVHLLINIYGVQLAAHINRFAVIAEIAALAIFSVALAVAVVIKGGIHTALLTTIPSTPAPYLPAFIISGLLAAWTIFGYEAPSDVSEETVGVRRIAPKSIIWAVGASAVLGFIFILILTVAIPDFATISATTDPISAIFTFYLGVVATKIFLFFVLLAIFALGILVITNVPRLVFAMARDNRLVGSSFFAKISPSKVPRNAAIFVAVIEAIVFVFAYGQVALYATSVILLSLVYLITIVNYALKQETLPAPDTFSLGKWRGLVITTALIWIVLEIGVFTIPQDFHLAALISFGVIAAGFVLQLLFARNT